jgi:hypothetical protein
MLFAAGIAGGYAGHAGLAQLQAQLEAWVSEWYLKGFEGDPDRASTDIGALGKLKMLDTILARVYVAPRDAARVKLLHRASYNTYIGTSWLARSAPMQPVTAEPGGLTWNLGAAKAAMGCADRVARRARAHPACASFSDDADHRPCGHFVEAQCARVGACLN